MALKISEEAAVQMPMKTVASLICMVAIGTWAYFGIIETQNKIQTTVELMQKDLVENTDFRIKWPRGQLGSLPADSEQFMMIEDLYKSTDKLNAHIESMALNKVNIEFLRNQRLNDVFKYDKIKAPTIPLKDQTSMVVPDKQISLTQSTNVQTPPLPQTPMPDKKLVASTPQIDQQTGLTQTEAALLSPSEQVIARRT